MASYGDLRQHAEMRPARQLREARSTLEAMWRVRRGLLREYRERLFVLGVTPVQARILLYLERNPRSYIMQCARAFGLTGRAVGYPVRVLEQKQWVTKQRAAQDDRYVVLTLTSKGTDLVRAIKQQLESTAWRKR